MLDQQVFMQHLLGPTGGVFAFGVLAGMLIMWIANIKLVTPWVQRAHEAEIKAMLVKIEMLELRIRQLERFEQDYMRIVEGHAKHTLTVPEENHAQP